MPPATPATPKPLPPATPQLFGPRRALVALVAGGIGGAMFDQIHVQLGVERYQEQQLFGQPWWVPPEFGIATVLLLVGALPLARARLRRGVAPASLAALALGFGLFAAAYLATGLFDSSSHALLVGLVALWAARMAGSPGRREEALFSLGLAVGGTAWESFLTSTGVYGFLRPGLGSVPLWLPGLYLNAGPLAVQIASRLTAPGAQRL